MVETDIVLLDPAGEEAYLSGEIAIRSPYVALGFLQKPDITRAAFINLQDPDGKRTYRTGDMGCILPDGSLEFRFKLLSTTTIRSRILKQ